MVDLKRTCRTCMKNNLPVVDLFGPLKIEDNYSLKLADLLMATTTLQINKEDGLPQNLCVECVKILQVIYTFRNQAHNAENELKKQFLGTTEIKFEHSEDELKHENDLYYIDSYDDYLFENTENNVTKQEMSMYICNICNKKYIERKRFLKHLSNHEEPKKSCPICNKTFHRQTSLNKHLNKHCQVKNCETLAKTLLQTTEDIDVKVKIETINEQYKCSECAQLFYNKKALLLHFKEHNIENIGDQIFSCIKCSISYLNENQLNDHMKTHSNILYEEAIDQKLEKDQYKCPECNLIFEKPRSLSSHLKKHKSKGNSSALRKLFECDYCDKRFSLKTLLRRHMRLHLLERPFKCTKCPKSYTRQDELNLHMNKHSGAKQYACTQCGKVFSQLCSLKDHIRTHTGETPFLCPQCGKGFKNNSNLRQHMMRHSGIKPFTCTFCPKTFCTKGQMKSHMDTHAGAHPYKCDECGAAFTKTNSLKKHQLIHLGIKPFPCDTCNMRFTSKDHMKRHRRIHTGEKPYRCTHCERAFTQSNDLVKHVRSHLGQNIYQCTVCQAKFRLMRELKRHYPIHYANGADPAHVQDAETSLVVLKSCSNENLDHNINNPTDTQIKITFNQNSSGDITIDIEPEKIND